MDYKVSIEKFEGPLDLLLQLIETEELDITQVSLSKVTDQFIEHLRSIEEIHPDELADFLVIAAKLLYIKSKVLLPALYVDEDTTASDLENQLKIYKEYWEAAKKIEKMIAKKHFVFLREKLITAELPLFNPPKALTAEKLEQIFKQILKNLEPPMKLEEKKLVKKISIEEKIEHIKQLVLERITTNFSQVLASAKDKHEVIVSFLAMLELVKQKVIYVDQDDLFRDILIKKV